MHLENTTLNAATATKTDVLRELRVICHSAWHINDLTLRLTRLESLKPGAIEAIRATVAEIRAAAGELETPACLAELERARGSEHR